MSLEKEIKLADEKISKELNSLSEDIVIKHYESLFDGVKRIALEHMKLAGLKELKVGDLYFKDDDHFYARDKSSHRLDLIELKHFPTYYGYSELNNKKIPEFTKYHSDMNNILNEFRRSLQESMISVLA